MTEQPLILHVGPDSASDATLDRIGTVEAVDTREDAIAALSAATPDVIVCEHRLDGTTTGLDVAKSLRELDPAVPLVLCTDDPDGTVAARATQIGVTEYVPRSDVSLDSRVEALTDAHRYDEQSHRQTAQRLDLALDGTDTGVYEWDLETGEIIWDEATAALFDTTLAAFGGSVADFHSYVHPEDRETIETAFERARSNDDPFEAEFRASVDGETRWIYTNGVVEDRDGARPRLVAIATDITEQKERELTLETNNESLQRLTELAAIEDLSEAETIERVLELGADRLGLSLGYLSRIEGASYEIVSVVGDHDVIQEDVTTALKNTYCRRIVEDDDMLGVRDAATEGWEHDMAYQMSGLACYLGTQVMVDGELYGTLCFADEDPRDEPFSDSEQTYIRLLAEWVSRELERRSRKDDLERYEDVIEAVDDGVYALDREGNFELVNDAMTELTAYSAEALLGSHTSTIKFDDVVERAESIVRSMIFGDRDEEETFDLEILRADGTSFPAEDHMTLLRDDDGTFEGTAGIIRDITERKERERELREARRRIEEILERIGDAFFAVDDSWKITYWNTRAEEILGEDAEDMLGADLWEKFPDTVGSKFHESYHRAMETQEVVTFEAHYPPVDSWFRVSAYPSEDGLSIYFHDITEQKERDAKLSGLLETSRLLMQARTPQEVAETMIQAAETYLGFDHTLVRLFDEEDETLVPAAATDDLPDRPVYDAHEAFPGRAYQRGETVRVDDFEQISDDYDHRYAKAGMYVPLDDHGVISVADTEGEAFDEADVSVAEILASNAAAALDRVEREQRLLRYETVIENVRDMVYVLDDDGEFQLVTEPLASWLGFDRADLVGAKPNIVLDESSIAAFEPQIRRLGKNDEKQSTSMETTLDAADGSERPAEIEISQIDDDVFSGTVGVVRDLTELKQTKAELRDERDRFSYLFDNLPDAVVDTQLNDGDPVVKSVNPAFTDVFGFDFSTVSDEQLNELVVPPTDDARSEAADIDARWASGETVQTELRRRTANGFRDFLFRGIPYHREEGQMWGFGIYTDITEQRDRERRLEVLNRVLRHNLRNDLTVVLGIADELITRLDDEQLLALLDRLRRKAAEIAELSDRAREIDQSARSDDTTREPIDVPSMVERLVETSRDEFDGTIDLSTPDTSIVAADGRFPRIVDEVIENSMEHAGEAPEVTVDVTADEETTSVTVADDGPGIPDHEIDVIEGEGPITQLSHGSGLGLWLVTWVTESYGGTVTFGESDAGGGRVTLTVPRTDR